MQKESFNKENITELFSQIVKILEKEGKTLLTKKLVKEVKDISYMVQEEIKKSRNMKEVESKKIKAKVLERLNN